MAAVTVSCRRADGTVKLRVEAPALDVSEHNPSRRDACHWRLDACDADTLLLLLRNWLGARLGGGCEASTDWPKYRAGSVHPALPLADFTKHRFAASSYSTSVRWLRRGGYSLMADADRPDVLMFFAERAEGFVLPKALCRTSDAADLADILAGGAMGEAGWCGTARPVPPAVETQKAVILKSGDGDGAATVDLVWLTARGDLAKRRVDARDAKNVIDMWNGGKSAGLEGRLSEGFPLFEAATGVRYAAGLTMTAWQSLGGGLYLRTVDGPRFEDAVPLAPRASTFAGGFV